ncbi:MAG TPA: hypothetical protein VF764_08180 [Steroidobacteraceae bacterium]
MSEDEDYRNKFPFHNRKLPEALHLDAPRTTPLAPYEREDSKLSDREYRSREYHGGKRPIRFGRPRRSYRT